MCCLFGFVDYQDSLSPQQKNWLSSALATAGEARGTDAAGIAYSFRGKLHIYKRPWPGHCMYFRIPRETRTVMGHTRMATQGNCRRNYNNHPFPGQAGGTSFALAHNGALCNDDLLKRKLALPRTRIATDSYVAVQLIEQTKALTLDSLRFMAEQVRGSFTFTILDETGSLHIIKGDSPFCLYHYPMQGLYIYGSTKEVLQTALVYSGLRLERPELIPLRYGEILQINSLGNLNRNGFRAYSKWGDNGPCKWQESLSLPDDASHLDALKSVAGSFGLLPEEIDRLYRTGFALEEIEDFLYNREI